MYEKSLYDIWISKELEDKDLKNELLDISGNEKDIKERFYTELSFGTGGLRGIIGCGTNRVNIYTIRKATQGFANYLLKKQKDCSVAIGYDSRIKSDIFAMESAKVLSGNNIKVYLYDKLVPTPCVSFAVRELGCQGGIMITASHNPSKYNGYKVYDDRGCQISGKQSDLITKEIQEVDIFDDIQISDNLDKSLISIISDNMLDRYYSSVMKETINIHILKKSDLNVVYTPLNGAGNIPVRKVLDIAGLKNISVVKEQEKPDGMFPTCVYPNPEEKETLKLALELGKELKSDIIIATDPDCDRVGTGIRDKRGNYILLSGNEIGAIIFQYICENKKGILDGSIVVKTIVTTDIIFSIADKYGVKVVNVLTGFKFIGEQIAILEDENKQDRYLFGFEESYGYLIGNYVRDKDAVSASLIICEIAAFYKEKGLTLIDVINNIYLEYGYYLNNQVSFTYEGLEGMKTMGSIMNNLRENNCEEFFSEKVLYKRDYKKSEELNIKDKTIRKMNFPISDVIEFEVEDDIKIFIRPSGTEPKIKIYYSIKGKNKEISKDKFKEISEKFSQLFKIS
ncbi:MAG: phospho-sugar mutase [Oscillospiraceae bacterium]|nr:phospho-sugar mutase [Oscillospiraceae bacterium]